MNLLRKYKISKFAPESLTENDIFIFNYIKNKLNNLTPFHYDGMGGDITYYMNKKGKGIFSIIHYDYYDGSKNTLFISPKHLSGILKFKYKISVNEIENIIKYMIKEIYNLDLKRHKYFPDGKITKHTEELYEKCKYLPKEKIPIFIKEEQKKSGEERYKIYLKNLTNKKFPIYEFNKKI